MNKYIIQALIIGAMTLFLSSCNQEENKEDKKEAHSPAQEEKNIELNSATEASIEILEQEIEADIQTKQTSSPAKTEILKDTPPIPNEDSIEVTDALDETTQEIDNIIKEIMGDDAL